MAAHVLLVITGLAAAAGPSRRARLQAGGPMDGGEVNVYERNNRSSYPVVITGWEKSSSFDTFKSRKLMSESLERL